MCLAWQLMAWTFDASRDGQQKNREGWTDVLRYEQIDV